MLKYIVAVLCGVSLATSVFTLGWGKQPTMQMDMDAVTADAQPPIDMTGKTDVHNTKCPVSGDDIGASTLMAVYKDKVYHLCCPDCIEPFNKEPEKYIKVMEADPAKYGVAGKS